MKLNKHQEEIFKLRYALSSDETWSERAMSVARHVAKAEENGKIDTYTNEFFKFIDDGFFIPAGRILYGCGRKNGMLLNCFSLGIDDNRYSIAKFTYDFYLTGLSGGGVGSDYSKIRPIGSPIQGLPGAARGVLSEIRKIDSLALEIFSGGSRIIAILAALRIDHPEILDFIHCKREDGKIKNHNISVLVTNEFLEAVKYDREWKFQFGGKEYFQHIFLRNDGKEYIVPAPNEELAWPIIRNFYKENSFTTFEYKGIKTYKAREIWEEIIHGASTNGEPGIQFLDNIKENFATSYFEKFNSSNPCLTGNSEILTNKGLMELKALVSRVRDYGDEDIQVLSFNSKTKKIEFKKVTYAAKTRENAEYMELTFVDRITNNREDIPAIITGIDCTQEHNFFLYNTNEKIEAQYLKEEMKVISNLSDKGYLYFEKGKINKWNKKDVYDITVEDNHNFFANGILVENCSEALLSSYGSCCLGSINLPALFSDKKQEIDWSKLAKTIRMAVRFLDNVLTVNDFPITEMEVAASKSRRIGLGVIGLHYLLIMKGYKYGSEESLQYIERLFDTIRNEAYLASTELAKEKGSFPEFDFEKYTKNSFIKKLPIRVRREIEKKGIRNAVILSIAPGGTISMVAGTSSGIEPIYAPIREEGFIENGVWKRRKVVDPLFAQFYREAKDLSNFIGATEIKPEEHLLVQTTIQERVCQSISKTINIPADYSDTDLSQLILSHSTDMKGVTVYRSGAREDEPLKAIPINSLTKDELENLVNECLEGIEMRNCLGGKCDI